MLNIYIYIVGTVVNVSVTPT